MFVPLVSFGQNEIDYDILYPDRSILIKMIDPFGSQGEQMTQTNFAQHGDMSDINNLRGGYSEDWTVYWITAHFLNAAAQFQEMGVNLESN
jgi:hypothetical protein